MFTSKRHNNANGATVFLWENRLTSTISTVDRTTKDGYAHLYRTLGENFKETGEVTTLSRLRQLIHDEGDD